jgi:hypothetical protein
MVRGPGERPRPLLRTSCGGYNIMARLNIEEEP